MSADLEISETAFWVNEVRARNEALSGDIYAKLWASRKNEAIWREYDQQLSGDHYEFYFGIRSRYFLSLLQSSLAAHPDLVFVNVGCGLSNYAFLAEGLSKSIEIDFPNVVQFKREKTLEWQKQGLLPPRHIVYLSANLNEADQRQTLLEKLRVEIAGKPAFILMEGITYFLDHNCLTALFELFAQVQTRDCRLAFDFFDPIRGADPPSARFRSFLETRIGWSRDAYNFFEPAELVRMTQKYYKIEERSNILEKQNEFLKKPVLSPENVAAASYACLKRL